MIVIHFMIFFFTQPHSRVLLSVIINNYIQKKKGMAKKIGRYLLSKECRGIRGGILGKKKKANIKADPTANN